MRDILKITRAIADPSRLRVISALQGRELCGCEIIGMLGLAQATVSRHMNLLEASGLVVSRKDGRWKYYRLVALRDKSLSGTREIIKWVHARLQDHPQTKQDRQTLKRLSDCAGGCR